MTRYESAKQIYQALGVDVEAALEKLASVPVSMHCWQGDDVGGFDCSDALSGGIQATGNYPGKATTPDQLMRDLETAMALIPGTKKLNLHASYAIFKDGESVSRDRLKPIHFAPWVEFAKKHGLGLDFNPTFFSHPNVKDNLTLSSPDEEIRRFWIEHGKRCVEISEYFAQETGKPCLMNIWIPDGYKDFPADRLTPRLRFADSLREIIAVPHDPEKVYICLESKVFGIGLEGYTVGSNEFCLNFAAHNHLTPLMDNGHYHPTETVSDKISAMLPFYDKLALHVTRPMRWDSDHVLIQCDDLTSLMQEMKRGGFFGKIAMGLDYFDASINRVAAWVIGLRAAGKGMLTALLEPSHLLEQAEAAGDYTTRLALMEEFKNLPINAVWNALCLQTGVPVNTEWLTSLKQYEQAVQSKR